MAAEIEQPRFALRRRPVARLLEEGRKTERIGHGRDGHAARARRRRPGHERRTREQGGGPVHHVQHDSADIGGKRAARGQGEGEEEGRHQQHVGQRQDDERPEIGHEPESSHARLVVSREVGAGEHARHDERESRQRRGGETGIAPEDVLPACNRGRVDDLGHAVLGIAQRGLSGEEGGGQDDHQRGQTDRLGDRKRRIHVDVIGTELSRRHREADEDEECGHRHKGEPARLISPFEAQQACEHRRHAARRPGRTEK